LDKDVDTPIFDKVRVDLQGSFLVEDDSKGNVVDTGLLGRCESTHAKRFRLHAIVNATKWAPCADMKEALKYWGCTVADEQTLWLHW
jgi:hypothetical protein